jgi:ABC-type phosphate transport system substrate-binding protein
MRQCCLKLCLIVATLVAFCPFACGKQLAVVTDSGNPAANLTAADLQKIFNLRTHNWSDGKPVVIVMRDPSSPEMQLFLRKVLNMTPQEGSSFVQAHKTSIVVADSDESVIRFVASNRGAIGVVDLYSLTKDVHVLKIDGKLPVEQGYLLRGE